MRNAMMVGTVVVLLAVPALAQQAPSPPPAPPGPTGSPAPAGTGPMRGQGPGMGPGMGMGMGMMGDRSAMRGMMHDDDDDDRGAPMRGRGRGERGDAPTQIIINIGPNNRVEVEAGDSRGARGPGRGMQDGMRMRDGWSGRSSADAVEAHLGYLRGALQLRPDQQPAWDRFAGAVRESAGRMTQSPMQAMSSAEGLDQRLAAHEAALSSRLDAARAVRAALGTLTSALDEAQRRSLDETAAVFIPGTGRMRSGMR